MKCTRFVLVFTLTSSVVVTSFADVRAPHPLVPTPSSRLRLKTYGGGNRGTPFFVAGGVLLLVGVPAAIGGLAVGLSTHPTNTPALVVGASGSLLAATGIALLFVGLGRQWGGGWSRLPTVTPYASGGEFGLSVLGQF